MKKLLIFVSLIIVILQFGCAENPPSMADGQGQLHITALRNTGTEAKPVYIPLSKAKVILTSEYGASIEYTDNNGVLQLNNLPSATYNISVRMTHPDDPTIIFSGSLKSVYIGAGTVVADTLITKAISSSGIAINEVYISGPVNNFFYFYDQYIELYNASDSVKYLDGMMVMRISGNSEGKGAGADEGDDGDIDGITYAFKFPGNPGEKNYPFEPHTYKVLAVDAVDHRKSVAASIDLSNADWEFFNQFSADDIDNPKVPNLLNMRAEVTSDYLLNLSSDIIAISSGADSVFIDGIDISTVIDAIEYRSSTTSKKTLDQRVDRGFIVSPPKYSGKSLQRREPGGDTNDATVDWEILAKPTPGKQ